MDVWLLLLEVSACYVAVVAVIELQFFDFTPWAVVPVYLYEQCNANATVSVLRHLYVCLYWCFFFFLSLTYSGDWQEGMYRISFKPLLSGLTILVLSILLLYINQNQNILWLRPNTQLKLSFYSFTVVYIQTRDTGWIFWPSVNHSRDKWFFCCSDSVIHILLLIWYFSTN